MRIFLILFLSCVTFRCYAILLPIRDWTDQYDIRRYPVRLSTLDELAEKSSKATDGNPHPAVKDCLVTADSVWNYWKPWPDAATCDRIKTWDDGAKITACWLYGHIAFMEHLVAIDEGWKMFSPNVTSANYHTRARLFYEDGSDVVIRQTVEPDDYRHYSHWFKEKIQNYETRVDDDGETECFGYCNLLMHRHSHNASGSRLGPTHLIAQALGAQALAPAGPPMGPLVQVIVAARVAESNRLVKIVLFQVKVKFPKPGVDPMAHYEEQNRLTTSPPRQPGQFRSDRARPAVLIVGAGTGVTGGEVIRANANLWTPQVLADFYEFDVAERKGKMLKAKQ
jgi:hypothetical protein